MRDPEASKQLAYLFATLTPEQTQNAMHRQLLRRTNITETAYPRDFRLSINLSNVNAFAPKWINPHAYIKELLKLNTPDMWKSIFQQMDSNGVHLLAELLHVRESKLPEDISQRNGGLYGAAVPLIAMAALYGKRIDQVRSPVGDLLSSAEAVSKAGVHFGSIAHSPEKLLERLYELFPESDADTVAFSALKLFHANLAFSVISNKEGTACTRRIPGLESSPRITINLLKDPRGIAEQRYFNGDKSVQYQPENPVDLTCYGINATQLLLEVFGRELRTEPYSKFFINSIVAKKRR